MRLGFKFWMDWPLLSTALHAQASRSSLDPCAGSGAALQWALRWQQYLCQLVSGFVLLNDVVPCRTVQPESRQACHTVTVRVAPVELHWLADAADGPGGQVARRPGPG